MRMSALAFAGFFAGAMLFIPGSGHSSPAAAGYAGEYGAARTFGVRDRFGGPSSYSDAGVFFRSDGVEIFLGTHGWARERRFGFDRRWDRGFRDRGFDRRFTGPRVWDRRFGDDFRFRDRRFGDHRFRDDRLWWDRRFHDRGFRDHRFTGPRVWDRRFGEDPHFKFRSRDWDRRQFHGPTHRPFGGRDGRFGPRSR